MDDYHGREEKRKKENEERNEGDVASLMKNKKKVAPLRASELLKDDVTLRHAECNLLIKASRCKREHSPRRNV